MWDFYVKVKWSTTKEHQIAFRRPFSKTKKITNDYSSSSSDASMSSNHLNPQKGHWRLVFEYNAFVSWFPRNFM